jgi:membrane protein
MNAGFSIHALVYCLVFGVIFTEIGFLDRQVLNKANSFGLTILALMAFIFDGLKNATPQMLAQVAGPLFGVIFIGVIGLVIFAVIAGKILGESIPMSISIAMNALYGFPPNFVLTEEAIHSLTDNKDKMEYLNQIMMPKMLVGGFTSVTIASVIIGGIFTGMLK